MTVGSDQKLVCCQVLHLNKLCEVSLGVSYRPFPLLASCVARVGVYPLNTTVGAGQWIGGGGGEEKKNPEWCKSGYCKLQYYVPLQQRLSVLKGLL